MLKMLHQLNLEKSEQSIEKLNLVALNNKNIFEELMNSTKCCSLGQITNVLFEIGGQYRRNM